MVSDLFGRAVALPESEREQFLCRECGDDTVLRRDVLDLLTADEVGGPIQSASVEKPAGGGPSPKLATMLARLEVRESVSIDGVGTERARGERVAFFGRQEQAFFLPQSGAERGQLIGDFRLVAPVGQGGMGQVWEAEQVSLKRRVALKMVRPDRVGTHAHDLFRREARAGGRLQHPGIVTVHAHGETDDVAWIAMEFVEGSWTLRDFLTEVAKREELPSGYCRDVAAFLAEVADALHAAHQAGVIHRDVKPQNVLVTPDAHPKVTDFGLARITDETALAATGYLAGTYYYMSPEQVAVRRIGIDHRTDVFSFGVMMYEMLALRRPFDGDTTHQVVEQILTQDPPDLCKIRSSVPLDLAVICGKALEKDRGRRYQTIAELAADIRRHLGHVPISARPPNTWRRAVKWAQRHTTLSVAAGVATVALVSISVLLAETVRARDDLQAATDPLILAGLVHEGRGRDALRTPDEWMARSALVLRRIENARDEPLAASGPASAAGGDDVSKNARELEQLLRDFPERRRLFEMDIAARYDDLEPLGEDPASGLREFLLTTSGEMPERDENGELVLDDGTGLVLVLLPGGTFEMGSIAFEKLLPVHDVSLDPFLISKYEMTRAQWSRMKGGTLPENGMLPAARISWHELNETLPGFDLGLPTEAQWEYACRGETETRFWPGNSVEELAPAANVVGTNEWDIWSEPAPVGRLRPNAFGLHDVHGNVLEWCLDGFFADFYSTQKALQKNPVAPHLGAAQRVTRGGAFGRGAKGACSACRTEVVPESISNAIGVRPVRVISE